MLGNISPLGLHQRAYGSFETVFVLTGAGAVAESGNVSVLGASGVRDISLIGLAMPERNFATVPLGVDVPLTGASAEAQAQFLVGAHAVTRVDDD